MKKIILTLILAASLQPIIAHQGETQEQSEPTRIEKVAQFGKTYGPAVLSLAAGMALGIVSNKVIDQIYPAGSEPLKRLLARFATSTGIGVAAGLPLKYYAEKMGRPQTGLLFALGFHSAESCYNIPTKARGNITKWTRAQIAEYIWALYNLLVMYPIAQKLQELCDQECLKKLIEEAEALGEVDAL